MKTLAGMAVHGRHTDQVAGPPTAGDNSDGR